MASVPMRSAAELDPASWERLSAAIAEFEAARTASEGPDLGRFLPPPGDPLRLRVLVELAKVDQERRWERGEQCLLEHYLGSWPELGRFAAVRS